MLLSMRLQKLHIDSLVVCHWMVFLKTRRYVKRNNAWFTKVSSFTSLLMCSTHFKLSCRILPFSLPTTNKFFKSVYSEITGEYAWQVLFRPFWCCFLLWQLKVIRTGLTTILDFWYPGPSYLVQEVLYFWGGFEGVCVSCTQRNALKSPQFSRCSITFFWPFYSFLQNWVITEVLVCSVYVLYECIVLDNNIRLLYFHVCFPAFVDNCVMDRNYHLHKSCLSTLARLRNLSSGTLTAPFFKHLPSPSGSHGMPLLALLVPQTLTLLSSNVWANLTLLWKLSQ